MDNFGARYDTSAMGRFMTPDWAAKPTDVPYAHFGNPQSLNLYSYVQNNPTTVGDPDGHCPWCPVVEEILESPEGQAVEEWGAHVLAGAGALLTTAATAALESGRTPESIPIGMGSVPFYNQENTSDSAADGQKNVPNPNGSKGAPDHQQTQEEERKDIGENGQKEVTVQTPGGEKGSRRIDAARVENGKVTEARQVIRPNKNGTPPAREVRAANDIQKATGVKPKMVPVRPCTNNNSGCSK